MDTRRMRAALFGATSLMVIAAASGAAAQTAPGAQAAAADASTPGAAPAASEVVVTATRREQRLQDVPLPISVLSGAAITESGYKNLTDLQYLIPTVKYNSSTYGFQIRGVGTQAFDYGVDQSVGIVVDGVVFGMPRNPSLNSLTDIDRVEVLRGPQGTLFGKNSSSGVIQVVTKRPVIGEVSGDVHLSFGENGDQVEQASVNLPINDQLAARVSFFHQHRDSFLTDAVNGQRLGDRDDTGVRAKLLWKPNERFDLNLIADYQVRNSTEGQFDLRQAGNGTGTGAIFASLYRVTPGPANTLVTETGPVSDQSANSGYSAEATYHFDNGLTLTSITAYRRLHYSQYLAADSSPLPILDDNHAFAKSEQISEEVRLTSPSGGRLQYVAGVYYFGVKTNATQDQFGTFGLPAATLAFLCTATAGGPNCLLGLRGGQDLYTENKHSEAVFGEATYHVTDRLRLIGGLRYTHDDNSAAYEVRKLPGVGEAGFAPLAPFQSDSIQNDNVSGRAGLQYDVAHDVMAYVTYARGYKGPVVSYLSGVHRRTLPEDVDDGEIGVKSQFLQRRLTVNLAAFYEKYTNFQAQVYDTTLTPAAYVFANAGGLESKGVEGDISADAGHGVRLSAAVSYNPTNFTDFLTQLNGAPFQAAGYPLSLASKWNFTLTGEHHRRLFSDFELTGVATYAWRDSAYGIVADRRTIIPSYGLLGLNVGVGPAGGRWKVSFFARNLLDTNFVTTIFPDPINPASGDIYNQPNAEARRTLGVMLDAHF